MSLSGCESLPQGVQDFGRKVAAFGTAASSFVGSKFRSLLGKKDQEKMGNATVEAAESGRTQNWKSADSKNAGSAKVVSTKKEVKTTQVKVLKSKIKQVPPLDIISQTYAAKSTANLRGGPGTDYVTVGSLNAGEKVTVVGKVKGKSWYLISQDGVGRGFVSVSLMARAAGAKPDKSSAPVAQSDISEASVTSEQTCRTIEQAVVLANGETKTETVRACKGPNGWEMSPIS